MTTTPSLTVLIESYIESLQLIRRLSANTVVAYQRDLATLKSGIDGIDLNRVDTLTIRRLITEQRHLHPSSLARLLSAWRTFFDYLIDNDIVGANPVNTIKAPKKPAVLPRALNPDEITHLLQVPAIATTLTNKKWIAIRDCSIMELLYSSALRLFELVQLNIIDIDLKNRTLTVHKGKGGKGRVVPIGQHAVSALKAWLHYRQIVCIAPHESALFISQLKKRLSARAIQKRLEKYAQATHLNKPASPHVFRHSCASHFLQSSGDLRATQELLGHKDISSTQIYTRLDFQHLAKVYDKAHPRAINAINKESK